MRFRNDNEDQPKCGIGMRFRKLDSTSEYLLVDCGLASGGVKVALVNLITGVRWTCPITVQDSNFLSTYEWQKVTSSGIFEELK